MRLETPKGNVIIREAWNDGRVGLLVKGDDRFCTNCKLTLLIGSPCKALFKIGVHSEPLVPDLKTLFRKYDVVEENKTITYKLNFTEYAKIHTEKVL